MEEIIPVAVTAYSVNYKEIIEKIESDPNFVKCDHYRILKDMKAVYGFKRMNACKKAVLKSRSIAGHNQRERFNDRKNFWKSIGYTHNEIKDMFLHNPVLLAYSKKRERAVSEILDKLKEECYNVPKELVLRKISRGAYIPNSDRGLISEYDKKGEKYEMPEMYIELRTALDESNGFLDF